MGRAQTPCCQSNFVLEQGKAMKPEIPSVPSCLRHLLSLQDLPHSFFRSSRVWSRRSEPLKSQPSFSVLVISWRKKMDSCKNSCSLVTWISSHACCTQHNSISSWTRTLASDCVNKRSDCEMQFLNFFWLLCQGLLGTQRSVLSLSIALERSWFLRCSCCTCWVVS